MSEANIELFQEKGITLSSDRLQKYQELFTRMEGKKEGFEDMGGAWRPSVLKIVQPVTTDAAKPSTAKEGDLFTKGGGVNRPLRGVVVYAWHTRVRFVQGADTRPSCSSENVDIRGRGKDDKSVSAYGDSCASCPHGDQPFTGGKQTNCNNVLNVLFIPEGLEDMYHLQFSKASFTIGRQLTDLARATPQAWSRFYEINTEGKKRERGSGKYFVMTVSPVADTPVPDDLKVFASVVGEQFKVAREAAKKQVRQRVSDVVSHSDVETLGSTPPEKRGFKDTF